MPSNCTRFLNLYCNCAYLKSICNGKILEDCNKCIKDYDVDNVCQNTAIFIGFIAITILFLILCFILYSIIIKNCFNSPYWIKHIIVKKDCITNKND